MLKENSDGRPTVNTKRQTLKKVSYAADLRRSAQVRIAHVQGARPRLMTAVRCGCC